MRLETDGAEYHPGAARDALPALLALSQSLPQEQAGVRLHGAAGLDSLLASDGIIGSLAAKVLGRQSCPVRALMFDKSALTNWSLGWHQDRTICVRARHETSGFGPWSIKSGLLHVTPPTQFLADMLTLRVHLDDVPASNAPLLIAPGSHAMGRIPESDIADAVKRCGTHACLALAGDVWLYRTLILHASERASIPRRRRVLQVDFAAQDLPSGLEWLGV